MPRGTAEFLASQPIALDTNPRLQCSSMLADEALGTSEASAKHARYPQPELCCQLAFSRRLRICTATDATHLRPRVWKLKCPNQKQNRITSHDVGAHPLGASCRKTDDALKHAAKQTQSQAAPAPNKFWRGRPASYVLHSHSRLGQGHCGASPTALQRMHRAVTARLDQLRRRRRRYSTSLAGTAPAASRRRV